MAENSTKESASSSGGKGISKWVNAHKGATFGIVFVVLVIIYFLYKSKESSSGTSSSDETTTSGTATSAIPVQYAGGGGEYYGGYSGVSGNNYGQIQSQLASLSTAISNLSSSSTGATATSTTSSTSTSGNSTYTYPTGESLVGSGYNAASGVNGIVQGANGNSYEWINPTQAEAAESGNVPLYYQPAPGTFVQTVSGQKFGQGTPLFQQVSSGASSTG